MKRLGYATAYFGKFELNKDLLKVNPAVDYHCGARNHMAFDVFNFDGDKFGIARIRDIRSIAIGPAKRFAGCARTHMALNRKGQPFFMVASFLNPHDIMYANANLPGQPPVQKALTNNLITPPPDNTIYQKTWSFSQVPGFTQSLAAPRHAAGVGRVSQGVGRFAWVYSDRSSGHVELIFTTIISTSSGTTITASAASGRTGRH